MPKKIFKITDFNLGLNNNSDPSSLQDNELFEAKNLELSQRGTIKMPGKASGSVTTKTTVTTGIDGNGSIAGWSSDHSRHTEIIYLSPAGVNTNLEGGAWVSNTATIANATAVGRVVLVKANVWYNSNPYDAVYVTVEDSNAAVGTLSSWSVADDVFYGPDGATNGTDYGHNVDAVEPGMGIPESNQWLAHLDKNGDVSVYNYQSDRWLADVMDLGSGSNIDGSVDVADQVLRASDSTFDSEFALANKSQWFGYIRRNMFQYDSTGDGTYNEGRWVAADSDLLSWGDVGCSVSLFDANTESPDATDMGTTAGTVIKIAHWQQKDESGLNAYEGQWAGTYEFGSAPVFDDGQPGEIDSLGFLNFAMHTLNIQVYVSGGTTDPGSLLSNINKWPGFGTTTNKRVTGVEIYFKPFATEDWFILKNVDFVSGDVGTKWDTIVAETEKGYGFGAMTSFDCVYTDETPVQFDIALDACRFTYTLANTTGWSGRTGFVAIFGFYYEPVYVAMSDIATGSGVQTNVPTTLPAAGNYVMYASLLDEDYQHQAISDTLDLDIAEGEQGPPPMHHPYGPCCWVATELWGYNDDRTHQARFYVINNNNWFTRLYKRYGITWSKIIKGRKLLQALIKPIWRYMSKQGKEFFNNPTGYPRITQVIKDLHKKYPGQFKYYLIGSNARRENVTHYYDINIVPMGKEKRTFAVWEDVLKTLYYVQEKDQRYANPSICPQFKYVKSYSGEEIYGHRDDDIDCYFYYDKNFPKNFVLENIGEYDNIRGDLYHNKIPLIGDKWRVRGLDKIAYANREIK